MICSLIHLHDGKGHVVSINASKITYIYDLGPTRSIRVGSSATWAVTETHEEIISMINALEDEDEPEVIKLGGPTIEAVPPLVATPIQAAVAAAKPSRAAKAPSSIDEVTPF